MKELGKVLVADHSVSGAHLGDHRKLGGRIHSQLGRSWRHRGFMAQILDGWWSRDQVHLHQGIGIKLRILLGSWDERLLHHGSQLLAGWAIEELATSLESFRQVCSIHGD